MVALCLQELNHLKNLRRNFNRFCFQNRDKGISNLMLYVSLGCALVYLMTQITQNPILYQLLVFDRAAILRGQVWRLVTWLLTEQLGGNPLLSVLFLYPFPPKD